MKTITKIQNKLLQALVFTTLIGVSVPSNAHLLGIAWDVIGEDTVRFYAETPHGELEDVWGGALTIGPWATHEEYLWTGVSNGLTFEELGIDGMVYWDPYDEFSTLAESHYDTHAVEPGTYNNFFYVDVPNFVTGEYLLWAVQGDSAIDRALSYSMLTAYIEVVPEPSVLILFGMGLLALWLQGRIAYRSQGRSLGSI